MTSGDVVSRRIGDMEGAFGGAFKRARAELGVESFGLGIIELPPNFDGYPEHDHERDGQEEVLVALKGEGVVEVEGERFPLDSETVIRIGPTHRRRVVAGSEGLRLMVIGAIPGEVYRESQFSRLGADDDAPRHSVDPD